VPLFLFLGINPYKNEGYNVRLTPTLRRVEQYKIKLRSLTLYNYIITRFFVNLLITCEHKLNFFHILCENKIPICRWVLLYTIPVMNISIPITISIIPPSTSALFLSIVPKRLPSITPKTQITNVTSAMIPADSSAV